jgi:origin recognition complex subunit 3
VVVIHPLKNSELTTLLQDVLRDVNTNVFNEIHHWVRESFNMITSFAIPTFPEATGSFPMVTDAASKQLFTGLVLTSKFSSNPLMRFQV